MVNIRSTPNIRIIFTTRSAPFDIPRRPNLFQHPPPVHPQDDFFNHPQFGPPPPQFVPLPAEFGPPPPQCCPPHAQFGPLPAQFGPLPAQFGPPPAEFGPPPFGPPPFGPPPAEFCPLPPQFGPPPAEFGLPPFGPPPTRHHRMDEPPPPPTIHRNVFDSHQTRDLDGNIILPRGRIETILSDTESPDLDNLEPQPLSPDTTPPLSPLIRPARRATSSSGGPSGRNPPMGSRSHTPESEWEELDLLRPPPSDRIPATDHVPYDPARLRELLSSQTPSSSPPSRVLPDLPLSSSPLPASPHDSQPTDMPNRAHTFSPFLNNSPSGTRPAASSTPQMHHGMPFEPQSTSSPPRSTSRSPPDTRPPLGAWDPESSSHPRGPADAPPPRQFPVVPPEPRRPTQYRQGSSSTIPPPQPSSSTIPPPQPSSSTIPPPQPSPELQRPAQYNQVPVNLPHLWDPVSNTQHESMFDSRHRPTTSDGHHQSQSQEPLQTHHHHQSPVNSIPSHVPSSSQWPGNEMPDSHPLLSRSGEVPLPPPVAELVENGYAWDGYASRPEEREREETRLVAEGSDLRRASKGKQKEVPAAGSSRQPLTPSQAQAQVQNGSDLRRASKGKQKEVPAAGSSRQPLTPSQAQAQAQNGSDLRASTSKGKQREVPVAGSSRSPLTPSQAQAQAQNGSDLRRDSKGKQKEVPVAGSSRTPLTPSQAQAQDGVPTGSSQPEDTSESMRERLDTLNRSVIHDHWINLDSYFRGQTDPAFIAFVDPHNSVTSRIRRLLDKLHIFLGGALTDQTKLQTGSEHWHGRWRKQLSSLDRTMQAFCDLSSVVCNHRPSFISLDTTLAKLDKYEDKFRDLTKKIYTLLNRLELCAVHSDLVKACDKAEEQRRIWDEGKRHRAKLREDMASIENRIALARRPSWTGSEPSSN